MRNKQEENNEQCNPLQARYCASGMKMPTGHAEEHRQEMIAIAKEVIKQYADTHLRQTIRQMVDEAVVKNCGTLKPRKSTSTMTLRVP